METGENRVLNSPDANGKVSLQRSLADSIIRMQSLDEIRILLACGAKVNEPVVQGLKPLHYAVWQKYTAAVSLLLVRGADVNATDDCGYSALHLAAEHGYLELAELLLKLGAKADYIEQSDDLYPRTTLCDEPLRLALRNKHYNVAKLLLEHGANPNKRYFLGSEINLVNDLEALELLLAFGANPETRDRTGMTPLMRAVRQTESMDQVLLLLSYGADVNAMTDARNDFRSVLHYAVISGNLAVVNLLLKQGATADCRIPGMQMDRPSPLHLAVLRGDPALVKTLLDNGANVNRCSPIIGSPLHVACADNIPRRVEIIKMILTCGADPNIKISTGAVQNATLRSPLAELLASNRNVSVEELRLLIKYGAKVIMKSQFRDYSGLLNYLTNIPADSPQFRLLVESTEEFNISMIRRSNTLSQEQKEILLQAASLPLSLKKQARIFFRKLFGIYLCESASVLPLPHVLKGFLTCDFY